MIVKVLFFGATAEVTGTRVLEIETGNITAKALTDVVISDHPELTRLKLLFSVNEEYVPGERPLNDGDELAIFTAVSGG